MPFHTPKHHSLIDSIHLIGASKLDCYVVYEDINDFWWQRFLKKGYRHSYLVIYDGFFYIKMDYTIGFMDIYVLPFYNDNTIYDVLRGRDCTYQYIEAWRKPRYRTLIAPWNCTEAVKSVLGIRGLFVLTPYQLYKHIGKYHG